MAGVRAQQPSLELGVRVVRVDGLDLERLEGGLFVRYYVPAGDGRRRLRVDTREVPCGAGGLPPLWAELARFERWGGGTPAAAGIAFELRWRPSPGLGLAALLRPAGARTRPSSRVLARAELPWADVASSSSRSAERWLALSPAGRELRGCKAPRLLVEVKAAVQAVAGARVAERAPGGGVAQCCRDGERCGQCGWVGNEEDMFLAATFSQLNN